MSVRRAAAYSLLKVFAELEFELKRIPRFVGTDGRGNAKVNWPVIDNAVRALAPEVFFDQVSMRTKRKMLGGARNRPMVHEIVLVGSANHVVFRPRNLPLDDAQALAVASRRVRNNLFHGGKEDPLEEQYPGDDQEWVMAACEVTAWLRDLVRQRHLI